MIKIEDIKEIIGLLEHSSIQDFTLEYDNVKVSIKKGNPPALQIPRVHEEPKKIQEQPLCPIDTVFIKSDSHAHNDQNTVEFHEIVSPIVGTFYSSPDPDSAAFVLVGDKVAEDSVVCIVESMKMFNEIQSEFSGEIVEVLAENGQLVEYGQPLFLVKSIKGA